ncbi:unnamed protein product [Rotaria sordida]|uniref:Transposase n=1 Tax=Rotaria sordida TaxID=392033 RepID=A0A813VDB0_9BILA|nr:unnamed protein product [Rotaria sordida]
MNSTTDDLLVDICSATSDEENVIPISTCSSKSTTTTTPLYSSRQLQHLLLTDKKKFCILNNKSDKTLAPWWRSFGYPAILNENNEFKRIPGFVSCIKCCLTSIYGPKSGTKRFIAHADRCFPLVSPNSAETGKDDPKSVQLNLDNVVLKRKIKLPNKEQNELKELCAKWVCRDLRPFSVVEDKGFEELAQMFIRIGAQYGLIDAQELLRSRQTVARTVNELALKYRTDLKDQLVEPLKSKSVTICPDFWSNKYTQQAFLGVNITFVNIEHEFKSVDLLCIPFNGVKSYDMILAVLRQHLSEFGITDLSDLNIITDKGANFIKAFAMYDPIYCFGHRLNNILKICFFQQKKKEKSQRDESSIGNTLSTIMPKENSTPVVLDENTSSASESELSDFEENQELYFLNENTLVKFQKKNRTTTITQKMSVNDIPSEAKKILTLIKQTKDLSGLNQEIKAAGGTTLHQACIRQLFNKQKQHLINDLNEQTLKQLVMLLKPFKEMIKIIQYGNAPSLHLVSMCYITLKEVLGSYEMLKQYNKDNNNHDDDENLDFINDYDLEHELPGITWFRQRLLLLLKEMFILDIRHVVATLLHPRYRSLKRFPDHIKNQCHTYVRKKIRQLRDKAEMEIELQPKLSEPTAKKFKNGNNLFSRFESENFDEDSKNVNGSDSGSDEFEYNIKKGDELDRYLLFKFEKNKETIEPLYFWKIYRSEFPFLSQYARSVLSIPATTTNVEREFSTAGWILNERRTNLKPEEVDKILFVRSMEKQ